jgi:glucokinase
MEEPVSGRESPGPRREARGARTGPPVARGEDFVLAIDFGGTKVALATAALDGRLVESSRLETHAPAGAAQALERALRRGESLIERTAVERGGRCLAVGAVSPGVVRGDRMLLAPNVPGWQELSLHDELVEGLGLPRAELGNDVKAAALAEARWGALRGADPGILLSLGTGVAAGIVIGGEVLPGAHGAAGEIGYFMRFAGGAPARLEEQVGGRAIGERGSHLLGVSIDAAGLFAHDDARARALVREALDELALHVANVAILLNAERIAVGGGLMGSAGLVMPALAERLGGAPFPPELVPARFVQDGPLRGAVALALRAAAPQEVVAP